MHEQRPPGPRTRRSVENARAAQRPVTLIVGATGNLGGYVARELQAKGQAVRALTRSVPKADHLKELGIHVVRGDVRDIDSLEFAMRGVTSVVSAAHSMLGKGEEASEIVDDEGQRALIDVAKATGVEHFVFTSVMGASPDHAVDFWRTKARIEEYLRESGVPFTIVRPTAFMEIHAYELIGKPVVSGKRVMLFGKGRNARNFVAARDVARLVVLALQNPGLKGETIDIGGPENLSGEQVVRIFERLSGKKAKVGHIPLPMLRVLARALKPVHPGISRVMKFGILGETSDQRFDPNTLLSRVPLELTRLEDWAREHVTQG